MTENISLYEWIGYAGSFLVAISLAINSIVKFRLINLLGALTFVVYGFLIGSLPVAFMNIFISVMDVYYLYKAIGKPEKLEILRVQNTNNYLLRFLEFYAKDIRYFNPAFEFNNKNFDHCFIVLRNMTVAGVFLGKEQKKGGIQLLLDYVIPEYRDYKNAHMIFDHLKSRSFRYIESPYGNKKFNKYLLKLKFKPVDGMFVKWL